MHPRWFTLPLTLALSVFVASAHAHGHDEDDGEMDALMAHYAEIAKFSEQLRVTSAVTPEVRLAGEVIKVGGPFWNLVQAWVRLDYQAVQKDCGDCIPIKAEDFVARAAGVMAKTYFQAQVAEPALEGLEHIVVGTADIGAQMGPTAAGFKVAAEVFETVLSKGFGLGGVHLFCHAIDVAIILATRPLNTAINVFRWAPVFGGSRLLALIKGGMIKASLARAQRRVRFVKGPVVLNADNLREVDAAGPRRWGWLSRGKRWAWVQRLDERGANTVGRKDALGKRRARYAFLRVAPKDLRGTTRMDKVLNQNNQLWIMSVQENIAQKAFDPVDVPAPDEVQGLAERFTPEIDDVRTGLADEFAHGDEGKARVMAGVLRDVEVIFNPAAPRRVRAFHAKTIESLLFGFMYEQNFRRALMHAGEVYQENAVGYRGKLRAIWKQASLQWRAGRFGGYVLDTTDFLFTASMSKDAEALARKKWETMDAVKRIFETYQLSGQVAEATDVAALERLKAELGDRRRSLMTFRPWVEKITAFRRVFAWLPFSRPAVDCHDLNRRLAL